MPNDGITAKFPTATVALADFGGSHPPLSAPTTLVLQTSLVAGDLSVVSSTPIPASYPAAGWITIDSEIIRYTSFTGSTFTVTRGAQQTTAASHTAGANIGLWFTPQELNQIEAEIVALESQYVQGANLASAATTDLSTATGGYVHITGTTTITSFGTLPAGRVKALVFDGALTLTYNATSLILQGGVNYTTAAGDVLVFVSEGAGNWRELSRRTVSSATTSTAILSAPVSNGTVGAASTAYCSPSSALVATETSTEVVLPRPGTLKSFFVRTSGAQPGTGTLVVTLRINLASSLMVITVGAGAAAGNFANLVNIAAISQGDRIAFQVVNNASGVSATIESISCEFA